MKLVNPVTHVVKEYSRAGSIKVPNTTGGWAFKAALEKKNVKVEIKGGANG